MPATRPLSRFTAAVTGLALMWAPFVSLEAAPASPPATHSPPAASTGPAAQATPLVAAGFGPDAVEDGIVEPAGPAGGTAARSAGAAAAALLSTDPAPTAPAPDPLLTLVQQAQDAVPPAEYSLGALAGTLPSDPGALDTFVRDSVGIDLYEGVLRGALGTWLGRAGNPVDKLLLLGALLRLKNVAFQFVRGTLSDAERGGISDEAKRSPRYVVEPSDARQRTYLESRAAAGRRFAAWIAPKLGSALALPKDVVPPTHYWVRVSAGGKALDLDPTMRSTAPGTHLGAEDTAAGPSSELPQALYATADVRLLARDAAGKTTTVVQTAGRVADLALAPIQVVLLPAEDGRAVTTMLVIGARTVATQQLAPAAATHVQLEITRTSPGGTHSTIARTVYDAKRDGGDLASHGLQAHTVVLYPESAPAFVAHVEIGDASVLAHGAALRRAGQDPGSVGFYPKPIADFIAVDDAMAATLGAGANIRLYRDRADVVMLHTLVEQTGAAEAIVHSTFDIGDNGMAAVGDKNAEAATNLARGWADTWIEKDIMGPRQSGAMDRWLDAKAHHVAFALASRGTAPTSFANGLAVLEIGADPAAASFWWDVDPRSGSAVGRGSGGYGQDTLATIAFLARVGWRGVMLSWTLFGIYSTAKECLSKGISVGCAIGVVGTLSSGLGGSIGKVGGRIGSTAGVLSNAYSTLTNPQNLTPGPEPPDPNAPNTCGLMCAPGDPSASDGDGPGGQQ